jgi:hypothetical protein
MVRVPAFINLHDLSGFGLHSEGLTDGVVMGEVPLVLTPPRLVFIAKLYHAGGVASASEVVAGVAHLDHLYYSTSAAGSITYLGIIILMWADAIIPVPAKVAVVAEYPHISTLASDNLSEKSGSIALSGPALQTLSMIQCEKGFSRFEAALTLVSQQGEHLSSKPMLLTFLG